MRRKNRFTSSVVFRPREKLKLDEEPQVVSSTAPNGGELRYPSRLSIRTVTQRRLFAIRFIGIKVSWLDNSRNRILSPCRGVSVIFALEERDCSADSARSGLGRFSDRLSRTRLLFFFFFPCLLSETKEKRGATSIASEDFLDIFRLTNLFVAHKQK